MLSTRTPRTFLSGDVLRIWTNPLATPNIIVLVRGTLYLSSIAAKDLSQASGMLSTGTPPEKVFGSYQRAIPLASVTRVEADLRHHFFRVAYTCGLGSAKAGFQLAGSMEADELVAILRQQLGESCTVSKLGLGLLRLWGMPLLALMLHAVICFFAWKLTTPRDGVFRRGSAIERWLQDVPGESGMTYFAITFAGVLVMWMIVKLLNRPIGLLFTKN